MNAEKQLDLMHMDEKTSSSFTDKYAGVLERDVENATSERNWDKKILKSATNVER